MSEKLNKIVRRRELLVQRSSEHRMQLKADIDELRGPLLLVDKGLTLLKFLRKYPLLQLIGSVSVITCIRSKRMKKWIGRVLIGWKFAKTLLKG